MLVRMKWALLASAVALVFPAIAGGELEPLTLSAAGASASSPRIASDGAGNVVTVWREVNGDQSSIRAMFRRRGGSWGELRQLSAPAASTESPELAMDRLGNAVAVWHRSTGRDSVVQAAVRPAGGTWSAPEDLSEADEAAFNADAALVAGQLTAVWIAVRDRRTVVESSSGTISDGWDSAETLSTEVGNSYAPVVAMDDDGGAVASWQSTDGPFLVVQAASRDADGEWTAPETLSGPGRHASRPAVAMDASGNALVGWIRYNGSWFAAQVARRNPDGAWEPTQNLSERGGNATGLDLAMNRRGDAVVSWAQSWLVPTIGYVWSAFRPAGAQAWSRVGVTEGWRGLNPRIALDEVGNATVVWAGSMTISASFKPVGQPWQRNYLLSGFRLANAQPAVTTHAPREATAVWVAANAVDDRVQGVSYDVDTSKEEADDEEDGDDEEEEEEEEETEEGETFHGTPQADRLVGTPGNDVFYGYGGNDTIDGRGGRDLVYGGPGRDRIVGGRGADTLFGGAGFDRILGGRGRDHAYGGLGDDRITGGTGSDKLYGGPGADRLDGGRSGDVIMGGYGGDVLRGNSGNDVLRGSDRSADVVLGGSGLDLYSLDRWLDRAHSVESRL